MPSIFLPRLSTFRLIGFTPIFSQEIFFNLSLGIHVVLGGNGLGKTTLMQAVVYSLTGGAYSKEIEAEKLKRWDHRYFHTRLDNYSSSLVEVKFFLGEVEIIAQRGLSSSRILKCEIHMKGIVQLSEIEDMQERFQTAIKRFGGYKRIEDFDYIIHKLLYLPESRRMIAWDQEVQARLLMLFCPDIIDEETFRKSRGELKRDDTNKRHIRVAINKAEKQIRNSEIKSKDLSPAQERGVSIAKREANQTNQLIEEIRKCQVSIAGLEDHLLEISSELSNTSTEIEKTRFAVDEREATLIARSIRKEECSHSLVLGKLLDSGICPSCGLVSRELQNLAQTHSAAHQCVLCGQAEPMVLDEELSTLRSTLTEKLRAQHSLAGKYRSASGRLTMIRQSTQRLEADLTKAQSIETTLMRTILERQLPVGTSLQDVSEIKTRFEGEERRFAFQILEKQKNLGEIYQQFRSALSERLALLRSLYQEYATAFLGLTCSLVDIDMPDKLFRLKIYVPHFNGSTRKKETDCSEAQRFFLDIAFRMSFIDFVSLNGGQAASFLCETPENALDMSYVSNVVTMFHQFCVQGHSVLLTANIQNEGLAQQILHKLPAENRAHRLLNMLEYGVPSEVQQRNIVALQEAVARSK